MSRGIAVHVVAGILFVAVGKVGAQESMPKPAVVEARDTLTSTVLPTRSDLLSPKNDVLEPRVPPRFDCAIGIEGDVGEDPKDNIEGRQNPAEPSEDASDSPQPKPGTIRRWFTAAMFKMLELVVRGVVYSGGI